MRGRSARCRGRARSLNCLALAAETEAKPGQFAASAEPHRPRRRHRPRFTPSMPGYAASATTAEPATSVIRSPNSSSITTTSPRAIGRPFTNRSTGLSANRSSVTTDPGPSASAWPSVILVRPTSTVSSTITSFRRSRSAEPEAPAAPTGSRGANSISLDIRRNAPSLHGHVGQQDLVGLDVGLLLEPLEDLGLDGLAALAAGEVRSALVGHDVGHDVAHDRL